jgi:hypothetical protein
MREVVECIRRTAFVLGLGALGALECWNVVVSKADEPGAGAKALPGAHRTLADLLEEEEQKAAGKQRSAARPVVSAEPDAKDWKWDLENQRQPVPGTSPATDPEPDPREKPQVEQAPVQALAEGNAVAALQQLIAERHRTVAACNLFQTIKQIVVEENQLRQLARTANRAAVLVTQAVNQANLLNVPGAKFVPPAAKAAARQAVNRAQNDLRRAQDAVGAKQRDLKPLYERITPHLGPWVRGYREMTKFLPPRRSDPNRKAVIQVLNAAVDLNPDFFEGRVLAAFGEAYDGNVDACGGHLDKAIQFIDQYAPALYSAHVTHDCAATCIVANMPGRVNGFIKMIGGLNPSNQSAFQQWLVASHAVAMNRELTAGTYFRRALAKVGAFKDTNPGEAAAEPLHPILGGDAAHFFLTQPEADAELVEKYAKVIARIDAAADEWQFARAQAALAASQNRWLDAQRDIAKCEKDCPATLLDAVRAEKAAYQGQSVWVRTPPKPATGGQEDQAPSEEADAEVATAG